MAHSIQIDPKTEFDTFIHLARELPQSDLLMFRGAPKLIHQNIAKGVTTVLAHEAELKRDIPKLDIETIRTLPGLALALVYATSLVDRAPKASGLAKVFPRMCELRRKLLDAAIALAASGALPKDKVEAIRRGRGKIDLATDAVRLGVFFETYAKDIKNKHAITAEEIQEARLLGGQALDLLKTIDTPKDAKPSGEMADAVDTRDRLWTLLAKRFDSHLWRAGAWLFGPEVDEHVPPLLRRSRRSKKGNKETPAQPAKPQTLPTAANG